MKNRVYFGVIFVCDFIYLFKWANSMFVYFRSFYVTNIAQIVALNYKSIDGVLGTQTLGGRMVGIDKSTKL